MPRAPQRHGLWCGIPYSLNVSTSLCRERTCPMFQMFSGVQGMGNLTAIWQRSTKQGKAT